MTRFSPSFRAYRLSPAAVLLPTSSLPDGLPSLDLNAISTFGESSPKSFTLAGFSSTTRFTSRFARPLVMPDASRSEPRVSTGAVTCHVPSFFFTVVTSPDSDLTVSSLMLSDTTPGNTFSLFDAVLSVFEVTK
jgi:hypothetical protein